MFSVCIMPTSVMVAALILAFWPGESGDARRAITENNLGTALQEEGRDAEAVERYQRALAFDVTTRRRSTISAPRFARRAAWTKR